MTAPLMTKAEFLERMRQQRRKAREAVAAFVDCASSGSVANIHQAITAMEQAGAMAAGFRAAGRLETVSDRFREAFAAVWVQNGIELRDSVNSDGVLKRGLRSLLPRYTGGAIILYRGDSAYNRKRRSYGLSWSSDVDVARSFALGMWRTFEGGSVLLRCYAPAAAILYATVEHSEGFGEQEFLVDRALVSPINIVEHFPQIAFSKS